MSAATRQERRPPVPVLQCNTGKSPTIFKELLQTLAETNANVLLIQEPPLSNNTPPHLEDFPCFPSSHNKCRATTYFRKKAFKSAAIISKPHRDYLITFLTLYSTERKKPILKIANVYNALENRNWRSADTPTHSLDLLFHDIFAIADVVSGDMNKHHPLWNPDTSPSPWAQNLADVSEGAQYNLANNPGEITLYPANGNTPSVIDLTFYNPTKTTTTLWQTRPDYRSTDHVPITFNISPSLSSTRKYSGYNWTKTRWHEIPALLPTNPINCEEDFNHSYHSIVTAIQKCSPTRRVTKWSRPWWNPDLAEMQRIKNSTFRDLRAGK